MNIDVDTDIESERVDMVEFIPIFWSEKKGSFLSSIFVDLCTNLADSQMSRPYFAIDFQMEQNQFGCHISWLSIFIISFNLPMNQQKRRNSRSNSNGHNPVNWLFWNETDGERQKINYHTIWFKKKIIEQSISIVSTICKSTK